MMTSLCSVRCGLGHTTMKVNGSNVFYLLPLITTEALTGKWDFFPPVIHFLCVILIIVAPMFMNCDLAGIKVLPGYYF